MSRPALIAWIAPPPAIPGQSEGPARARAYGSAACRMEQAGVDLLILDDSPLVNMRAPADSDAAASARIADLGIDPAVLGPMLGDATASLTIAPAVSSGLYPPYMAARLLSTLDHQTKGRAALNIVVPGGDPLLETVVLGKEADMSGGGYARAADFLKACSALWTSWRPDALVLDTVSGLFADPARVAMPNYEGPYFKTRGPLNNMPSPQGDLPVVHVAGDAAGLRFAAEHADIVVVTGATMDELEANWNSLKSVRPARKLVKLVALRPFVASTEAGARALRDEESRAEGVPEIVGTVPDAVAKVSDIVTKLGADGVALASSLDLAAANGLCARLVPALRSGPCRPPAAKGTLRDRLSALSGG